MAAFASRSHEWLEWKIGEQATHGRDQVFIEVLRRKDRLRVSYLADASESPSKIVQNLLNEAKNSPALEFVVELRRYKNSQGHYFEAPFN